MSRPLNADAALCEKSLPMSLCLTLTRSLRSLAPRPETINRPFSRRPSTHYRPLRGRGGRLDQMEVHGSGSKPACPCRWLSSILAASAAALVFMTSSLQAGPRDAQWKAVEEAIQKGLPKTAITNLEPIIQGALNDNAYAEAVKAIGQKIALEGNIQGNKPEEKITRLEAEISKAPKEMVPLMDTLLAEWYWQYFQQNRWRFMRRTATARQPGKDFTTWDLPRLFAEIDKQFQKALAADKILKATPISVWDGLLQKGTMPDSYRPTLYDFIAYQALQFYTSGEQAAAKPEDAFELSADSPILDSAEKFIAVAAGCRSRHGLASAQSRSGFTRRCSASTRMIPPRNWPLPTLTSGGSPGAGIRPLARTRTPATRRPWRRSSAPMPISTSLRWP